jgi:hypothetical protein
MVRPRACRAYNDEPKRLRRSLDQFSFHIARTGQPVLEETFALVEGESEAAFLETLIELRFFGSRILGVAPYHGKGNAKASRLPAADLQRRGVLAVVQVDADRSARSFDDLKQHLAAHSGSMFKFSSDFEGAFPAPFLSAALEELGHAVDVTWLTEQLASSHHGPIVRAVEQKLNVSISKPALARQLAYITRAHWASFARRQPPCEIVLWIRHLNDRPECLGIATRSSARPRDLNADQGFRCAW